MAADAFFIFDGGSFDGPKLKGKVLPGGGGLSLIRRDDVAGQVVLRRQLRRRYVWA